MVDQYYVLFYQKFALEKLAKYLAVPLESLTYPAITDPNAPHCIDYGDVRYDVKIARIGTVSSTEKNLVWDFDVREKGAGDSQEKQPDFYLLVGVESMNTAKVFLMPLEDAPKSHIRISVTGESKYHKYQI